MTTVKTQSWKKMRFADFVDTAPKSILEKSREYPFIPMELIDGISKYPTSSYKKEFSGGGSRFMNGDTVFARITPCLENGKIAQIKSLPGGTGFGSTELFVFRSKEGISDKEFIYYLSRTDEVRSPAIKSMVGASGRQRADKSVVENLEVLVPSISKQQDIAGILSKYDDIIENNTQRIQILERIAQAIYQDAFASSTRKSVPLGEAITIHRGKSYGSHELSETDGIPFVNLKCIDRDGGFRKSGLKRFTGAYKDTHKAVSGDIVMAITDMTQDRRIVARAARVPTLEGGFGVISMDLVKIHPKDGFNSDYIYSLLRWSGFPDEVKNHANGANVLHLIPDRITDYQTFVASPKKQEEFGQKVSPIFNMIDKLELQNESLRQSRDLLLPKLVTGEIKI